MNISEIAAKHNITSEELATRLTAYGWDFSQLDQNNAEHVRFASDTIESYAKEIAAQHALKAARAAKAAAERLAAQTPAARKNPEAACYKCDGKGTIRGFGHIENGKCFVCAGAGVRGARKARRG